VKSSELFRILQNDGWFVLRQNGSHIVLVHKSKTRRIISPYHGSKEIGKGLEMRIKKDAGLL
jgi:predicted RNA binding protein YcfA (HicA-like mRNA interferase family)